MKRRKRKRIEEVKEEVKETKKKERACQLERGGHGFKQQA